MVKMVPYEAFACRCGAGDVVLRESYKHETRASRKHASAMTQDAIRNPSLLTSVTSASWKHKLQQWCLSNEKDNETLIALMPILSVEDLYGCIPMIISVSKIVSSSRSFGSAVLGQMTYLVASSTLDSARSYVMQGASFIQGTVSSIPIGGYISPGGFLPFILLVVILVMVVIVVVVLVVVVIGVVIVVAIIGEHPLQWLYRQSSDESFQEFLSVRYHAWAYDR
ncbi:hypothetical protein Tco_0824005 [Tanacetum coccineum]|uniref:SLC26A/SulP transporter domain-containing protein n=1 Tax=Tanacetum coccineum TaxID=301880 RepID=A0ABQ5ANK6_9ASTR